MYGYCTRRYLTQLKNEEEPEMEKETPEIQPVPIQTVSLRVFAGADLGALKGSIPANVGDVIAPVYKSGEQDVFAGRYQVMRDGSLTKI